MLFVTIDVRSNEINMFKQKRFGGGGGVMSGRGWVVEGCVGVGRGGGGWLVARLEGVGRIRLGEGSG